MKYLYENIEGHKVRCALCGKEIFWGGMNGGFATKSHARKHVREGKAKETHTQSKRCFAGIDVDFILVEA